MLTMCFWELALNNKVQTELIAEIDAVVKTMNSKSLSYAQLQTMKYLDMFIHEILRKYPSLPYVLRVCNKDCFISTHDSEIFKFLRRDIIQIPLKSIQNDAKYFPKPELFDPSRFKEPIKYKLLAFGVGPKKCLGKQFALLQAKTVIFCVLRKFSVETLDKNEPKKRKLYLVLKLRGHKPNCTDF